MVYLGLVETFKMEYFVTATAWKVFVLGVILVRISRIRTEYGVIWRMSPYSVRMQENMA